MLLLQVEDGLEKEAGVCSMRNMKARRGNDTQDKERARQARIGGMPRLRLSETRVLLAGILPAPILQQCPRQRVRQLPVVYVPHLPRMPRNDTRPVRANRQGVGGVDKEGRMREVKTADFIKRHCVGENCPDFEWESLGN